MMRSTIGMGSSKMAKSVAMCMAPLLQKTPPPWHDCARTEKSHRLCRGMHMVTMEQMIQAWLATTAAARPRPSRRM